MAVACTIICSGGIVVHIHDDDYAGLSEDEISRRQQEIRELAEKILLNAETEKLCDPIEA